MVVVLQMAAAARAFCGPLRRLRLQSFDWLVGNSPWQQGQGRVQRGQHVHFNGHVIQGDFWVKAGACPRVSAACGCSTSTGVQVHELLQSAVYWGYGAAPWTHAVLHPSGHWKIPQKKTFPGPKPPFKKKKFLYS